MGLCSYLFLTVAARHLDPAAFGELSALWVIVFGFVAGLWYPFEQELTRVVAAADRARTSDDIRRVGRIQASTLLAAQVLAIAYLSATSGTDAGMAVGLGAGLLLSVASLAAVSFQRGRLLGTERYGWAATQQVADGLARAAGGAACVALGLDVEWFGVVLGAAPLVGVLAAWPGMPPRGTVVAAGRSWAMLTRDLLGLLFGSYIAIVLLNVGPLVVRASAGPAAAGLFMAIFVVARLPVYFAGVAAAGFLPRLVQARVAGGVDGFARLVRVATVVVVAVSVVGCLLLGLLGPWLAETFFGAAYAVDLSTSVLLALSSAGFVTALLLQMALIAADRQRAVAWTWAIGAGAFVLVVLTPIDAQARVASAYLVSSGITVLAMAAALRIRWLPAHHRHPRATDSSPH